MILLFGYLKIIGRRSSQQNELEFSVRFDSHLIKLSFLNEKETISNRWPTYIFIHWCLVRFRNTHLHARCHWSFFRWWRSSLSTTKFNNALLTVFNFNAIKSDLEQWDVQVLMLLYPCHMGGSYQCICCLNGWGLWSAAQAIFPVGNHPGNLGCVS